MSFRSAVAAVSLLLLGASPPLPTPAPGFPVRLSFVPRAALFSLTNRQPTLVDPGVFVADPTAPAALGLAQIAHVAGERNAEMSDDASAAALDANARQLGFNVQQWFAANGVVQLDAPDTQRGGQTITVRFANLVPRGRYSLFLGRFERTATYAPLDGTGRTNSFTTTLDGTAGATLVAPQAVPRGSALLLVYHADHRDHGMKIGTSGIDAFEQLMVRVP